MSFDVPHPTTPDAPDIVGPHWPTQSESSHGKMALDEIRNALTSHDMSQVSTSLSSLTQADFHGATGTALTEWFARHGQKLMDGGEIHFNQGAGLSAMAQNILNTKLGLTGVAEKFQAAWEALQAQAIAEGWTQAQFDDARTELLNQAKAEAGQLGEDFQSAHSELNHGVKTGSVMKVPSSMPPTPADAPSIPGAGGNFGEMASALPQMFAPLGQGLQALNPQQLMQPIQQAVAPMASSLKAHPGSGGGVPVTREALNKMIQGQGGTPLGEQRGSLSAPKAASERNRDSGTEMPGRTPGKEKRATMSPSEGAAMAAPPESAAPRAEAAATTLSSAGAQPDQRHSSPETNLSSGPAGGHGGAPVAPPPAAGGGAGMGGAMMMPPMMPMAPAAGGASSPAPSARPSGDAAAVNTLADADGREAAARLDALRATAGRSRDVGDTRAVRLLAALRNAHRAAGVSTGIAVAEFPPDHEHPDGRAVFATSDGLGLLPFGVSVPRADSLASLDLPDAFRADWLGCSDPGRALSAAMTDGLLPVRALTLVTTERSSGTAVWVDEETVSAALAESCPVSRSDLPALPAEIAADAVADLAAAWGADQRMPLAAAEARCWGRRWDAATDPRYRESFAQYLVSDALFCLSRGDVAAAAYAAWHLVRIPR